MRDGNRILDTYLHRQAKYAAVHAKMHEIATVYNGRAIVPLPDMDRSDKPSNPNLLAQGVDQMAGRITSVVPSVIMSSEKPGQRKADRDAQAAARVLTGWWQADRLQQKMKVRGRRLIAYGSAPVIMRWDFARHRPSWEVKHPLDTFPSLDLEPGQVRPADCIFTYMRTVGWLVDNGYHVQMYQLFKTDKIPRDQLVKLIEWVDAEHTVLIAIGGNGSPTRGNRGVQGIELECYENLSDTCPVVIPTRITLDEMTGQFDVMLGMYYKQAKLTALEEIAIEKGIFPDTYIESRQGEVGKFLDGPYDGRTGKVNIVAGGVIKEVQSSPGYMTPSTIDRIERASRISAGIPSEFGGESGSNIRTGRRGDAVLAAVIDYPVAEAQQTFEFALEQENEIAIEMAKKVDGGTERTIFVGTGNNRKPVTYTASKTFGHKEHVVSYPAAGADMNSLMIGIGQRVGLGTMSKRTAQIMDPFIDDPEGEHDTIIYEGIEQALMAGLQQQAAAGAIPPLTLSKIMTLVVTDKMELAQAITKVTEDAMKEAQETQGAPATPDQLSAGPTTQAMAGMPAIPPVEETMPGMDNLSGLLASLRRPTMTVQPMRGVETGAA